MAGPKNEEGRTGADAQTDANKTDRQDRQTQTQETDAIRQFAVVEDESKKHLIVDNLAGTTDTNHTMPADNIDESPMTVARGRRFSDN